jgi:hypothetical protein
MVLLSFSDKKHVPLILNGQKAQTTRKPRKNPVKVGDTLQVYFKSRVGKGHCKNCLRDHTCPLLMQLSRIGNVIYPNCPDWINFFGTAKVIDVKQFRGSYNFTHWIKAELEYWAKNDGFPSFKEANEWFTKVHGPDWMSQDWDIIYFKGDWL